MNILMTASEVDKISKSWLFWSQDEKNDILEHIKALSGMIDPEQLALATDRMATDRRERFEKREAEKAAREEARKNEQLQPA